LLLHNTNQECVIIGTIAIFTQKLDLEFVVLAATSIAKNLH
jgi:hypothetical protein